MKIEHIATTIIEMPYRKPLITATNKFVVARGILVEVISAGAVGYGYSELFPRTGETPESARYAVEGVIKPKILGKDLQELVRLRVEIDRMIAGNPRAKAALDVALYDALGRNLRAPLYLLLGGRYRTEIRVIKMVSVDDPEAMAEEAKQCAGQGMALKLKMSGNVQLDLQRVAAVRARVGENVFMKVDANEAYDAQNAIRLAKGLADHGVEIFEQPVPRNQFDVLWEVKRHSPVKIEADQSVRTLDDAYVLIKNRMVDAINTGIQKIGGIHEVRRIVELCQLNGIRCALSNTAGTMVGDAAAIHLAASTPGIAPLAELGEFEVISGDPFVGLEVKNGCIRVPEGIGLGVKRKVP